MVGAQELARDREVRQRDLHALRAEGCRQTGLCLRTLPLEQEVQWLHHSTNRRSYFRRGFN